MTAYRTFGMKRLLPVVALLALATLTLVACDSQPKATPVELAEQYVNANIEQLSNELAAYAVRDLPVAKDVLGEYVERQVQEAVDWRYAETENLGDDQYVVTATASVVVPVDVQVESLGTRITGQINISMPFDIAVDHEAQIVRDAQPNYDGATVNANLPGLKDALKQKARDVAESAGEDAQNKLKGLLKRGQ